MRKIDWAVQFNIKVYKAIFVFALKMTAFNRTTISNKSFECTAFNCSCVQDHIIKCTVLNRTPLICKNRAIERILRIENCSIIENNSINRISVFILACIYALPVFTTCMSRIAIRIELQDIILIINAQYDILRRHIKFNRLCC